MHLLAVAFIVIIIAVVFLAHNSLVNPRVV